MEAVTKQRRSVVKRQKKSADKQASKNGPVKVHLNDVPTSDRKMRLVADLIRGKEVNQALSILKFQAKSGSIKLEKLLVSAMADWEAKRGKIDESDIYVKEIFVNGGKILKRLRPAPQGRAHRIRKRSNHVTMILDSVQTPLTNLVESSVNSALPDTTAENIKPSTSTGEKEQKKAGKSKTKKNDNK